LKKRVFSGKMMRKNTKMHTAIMTPQEYKYQLKQLFASMSPREPDTDKLQKIDDFRRIRGVQKHLKRLP